MKEIDFKNEGLKYYDQALNSLKEFVSINTINDQTTIKEGQPFGKGVRLGLDYVASLGEKLGFKVDRCDYYCTELTMGEGPLIDVYAHADVVPVSKNWKTDPFYPTIKDNTMYARGCSDDKGPLISCLYGIKMLIDNNLIDGYKVRFIVGGDEERGSECLEHYFHSLHKQYPTYGISPDANYPLIFAEKGIYAYKSTYNVDLKGIKSFSFGQALNIVLDEVNIDVDSSIMNIVSKYASSHKEVKITYENNALNIKGKASHGSVPWNGINAGLHLLNLLSEYLNLPVLHDIYEFYKIGDGKAFNGNYSSKYFKESSYCVGKMEYSNGKLSLFVNMRLPDNTTCAQAIENVKNNTKCNEVESLGGSDGFIIDPESDFIKALLKVYQKHTGDTKSKPCAIGGGTYSRETKNTVAFGMEFPGVDTLMHQDGEFLPLDAFKVSIGIYGEAIYQMGLLASKKNK
jgi:succinyl-diaminopimelate desuccinylase